MNAATVQLEAGGLLPAKAKVDADATEQIVARTYSHPALGDRRVRGVNPAAGLFHRRQWWPWPPGPARRSHAGPIEPSRRTSRS